MHLASLSIRNFRNFVSVDIPLAGNIVLLGENRVGKSNLLFAIRLVLDPTLPDSMRQLKLSDFWDGCDLTANPQIEVHLDFADFDSDDMLVALLTDFRTAANPTAARLSYVYRKKADLTGAPQSSEDCEFIVYGGGDESRSVPTRVRRRIAIDVLDALRDAEGQLASWRHSPLRPLLEDAFASVSRADLENVATDLEAATAKMESFPSVKTLEGSLRSGILDLAGTAHDLNARLRFAPADPIRLIRSIAMFIDDGKRGIAEASLGSANVALIALKLAEFAWRRAKNERNYSLLCIEEPEAHLHPQLQRAVFEKLFNNPDAAQALIVTSHSPTLAAIAPLRSIVTLRRTPDGLSRAYSLAALPVNAEELDDIERYLTATRSELLFARGVILVEGDAEEALLPAFADALGYNLDQLGITVCNVAGVNFVPYVKLAGSLGLPFAVVTDWDPLDGTKPPLGKARTVGIWDAYCAVVAAATQLTPEHRAWCEAANFASFSEGWAKRGIFLNDQTFEVAVAIRTVSKGRCWTSLTSKDSDLFARRALRLGVPVRPSTLLNYSPWFPISARAGWEQSFRRKRLSWRRLTTSLRPSSSWHPMSNRLALMQALAELEPNRQQYDAAVERGHCVVLAGPGSGKTKTLTTAMARALMDDVVDPRGVACITYNNECAMELEERLAKFGVANSDRSFIGTVHSFALTQVIVPYARCIAQFLPDGFRIATSNECHAAVEASYKSVFGDAGNVQNIWRSAEEKRRRDVDRTLPAWRGKDPELAAFIEAYEAELRRKALIDFDDMPLIAYRMIKEHRWIRNALRASFPVLFVDEYQDLGHALHELVLLLCFESGIRLFAVGDADQSIYGFNGANPRLLQTLTARGDVKTIRLRFNYRSGAKIIRASLGALGEERDYCGMDGAPDGELSFRSVEGDHDKQARHIAEAVLPSLLGRGFQPEQIAILYRAAWLGDKVADALKETDIAILRTDGNALVRRNSRLARFVEACSRWVTGGWRDASPPYHRLLGQALAIVYGGRVSVAEEQAMTRQLMAFLRSGIDRNETTHAWLTRFCRELIAPWQEIARNTHQEWEVCSELVVRTDPAFGRDMPLNVFSGRIDGSGRVTLSTLHSAKGREFDAVILFGINAEDFPNWRDVKSEKAMREARRLFYVGVTRPRKELCLVFKEGNHSPWVAELYQRSQQV